MLKTCWHSLLDFLFPPHCPVCHAYVENQGDWCSKCLREARQTHLILLPAPMHSVIKAAWALGIYRGGLRSLIHDWKYKKRRSVLPYVRTFLRAADFVLPEAYDFAVPVPLHKNRERRRGFNQVEVIFGDWLQEKGVPLRRALLRVRETRPLYDMTPQERKQNLNHAFVLAPGMEQEVAGRHILLLDDILTTGMTLMACAAVLRQAGAACVDVLVFASDHR